MTYPTHILSRYWLIKSNGQEYVIGTKHKLYILRYTIMSRCYNAKPTEYKWYQGKGIQVYEQWKNNPESFFQWCLDNGWKDGMSLDRIDPERDYIPENCQFLSIKDNLKKMHKQRVMIGENAPHAKLTQEQVKEIKNKLKIGVMGTRIAKDFNVAKSTIYAIKHGKNWKET